jgi:hypothetical protein
VEECGPCPVFASFTLAFGLQLRKKHGKTSVRVRKENLNQGKKKNLSQGKKKPLSQGKNHLNIKDIVVRIILKCMVQT